MASRAFLGKGVAACARPVFATKRNTKELGWESKTKPAVTCFPGISLVLLRDWCASTKLVADGTASGLSDVDALFVSVLVLPSPVMAKVLGRVA